MAYLLKTHVTKKYLLYALCSVYGIEKALAFQICTSMGLQKNFLTANLSDDQIYKISQYVEERDLLLKGDLTRWTKQRIDGFSSIKLYRGIRHRLGLPVRGQRTHTNAQTVKKLRRLKKR